MSFVNNLHAVLLTTCMDGGVSVRQRNSMLPFLTCQSLDQERMSGFLWLGLG